MDKVNKLRLLAGIPIDPTRERRQVTETRRVRPIKEARQVPIDKKEVKTKSKKNMEARIHNVQAALEHLEKAHESLEAIPATDYLGDIPQIMDQLEDILEDTDTDGLRSVSEHFQKEYDVWKKNHDVNSARKQEHRETAKAEEEECSCALADEMTMNGVEEECGSVHEEVKEPNAEPVSEADSVKLDILNVDGQDDGADKDESPVQLKALEEPSKQDQSNNDVDQKVKVPAGIKQALKTEIDQAKKEAEKLNVSNRDAATFYGQLANAFEDLLGHLEGGTVYDMKQAQIFMTSLMGPILHKIPANVVKFIAHGGQPRSLQSIMKDVSKDYPKIGPQDVLK